MPIDWQVNARDGWIDVRFSNPYTTAESEQVMREIFITPGLKRPLRFLIDVRQSTPPDTEFVVNAITFWQLRVAEMWGAKIAVITANDAQAAKAQLSQHSTESRALPFTIRDFPESDFEAAAGWLRAP